MKEVMDFRHMVMILLYYVNCDSYNNDDPLTDGNTADGFAGGSGGTENDTLKIHFLHWMQSMGKFR